MPESVPIRLMPCPCGSGKSFAECHGASTPIPLVPVVSPGPVARKLDLACGQSCVEGFEGVDIAAVSGVKHVHDLNTYPWPFDDNSVAEVHCSHYIEHIPMEYVLQQGRRKDALFAFFDEVYRILIPGGSARIICPAARHDRAFQDPTHRRFIVSSTWLYFNAQWRKENRLDHYNVDCDFGVSANPTIQTHLADGSEIAAMTPGVQQRWMAHSWNVIADWVAVCESKKPVPKPVVP